MCRTPQHTAKKEKDRKAFQHITKHSTPDIKKTRQEHEMIRHDKRKDKKPELNHHFYAERL